MSVHQTRRFVLTVCPVFLDASSVVRFVESPDLLERIVEIDTELRQVEESLREDEVRRGRKTNRDMHISIAL